MKACKFCQMPEGAPGGRTGVIHINRDGLCGPCATLLDKVKYQPEKVDEATLSQFLANCEWNFKHGLFVPVSQRKALRDAQNKVWRCKSCGRSEADGILVANGYKNYCACCAEDIRCGRVMPLRSNRKTRSDKGRPRPKNVKNA